MHKGAIQYLYERKNWLLYSTIVSGIRIRILIENVAIVGRNYQVNRALN